MVKGQGKTHNEENIFKILLLLDCHQMFNRELQCSNSSTISQCQTFDYRISNSMMSSKIKFGQQVKYAILVEVNNNHPNQSMVNGQTSSKIAWLVVKRFNLLCWSKSSETRAKTNPPNLVEVKLWLAETLCQRFWSMLVKLSQKNLVNPLVNSQSFSQLDVPNR